MNIVNGITIKYMETIILLDGSTVKGTVEELGFNGLYWCGYYKGHFVTWHNNCWMER
jgi:hypothetical protein